jgi:hypothetical protein
MFVREQKKRLPEEYACVPNKIRLWIRIVHALSNGLAPPPLSHHVPATFSDFFLSQGDLATKKQCRTSRYGTLTASSTIGLPRRNLQNELHYGTLTASATPRRNLENELRLLVGQIKVPIKLATTTTFPLQLSVPVPIPMPVVKVLKNISVPQQASRVPPLVDVTLTDDDDVNSSNAHHLTLTDDEVHSSSECKQAANETLDPAAIQAMCVMPPETTYQPFALYRKAPDMLLSHRIRRTTAFTPTSSSDAPQPQAKPVLPVKNESALLYGGGVSLLTPQKFGHYRSTAIGSGMDYSTAHMFPLPFFKSLSVTDARFFTPPECATERVDSLGDLSSIPIVID